MPSHAERQAIASEAIVAFLEELRPLLEFVPVAVAAIREELDEDGAALRAQLLVGLEQAERGDLGPWDREKVADHLAQLIQRV